MSPLADPGKPKSLCSTNAMMNTTSGPSAECLAIIRSVNFGELTDIPDAERNTETSEINSKNTASLRADYALGSELGRGSCGIVRSATRLRDNVQVVVKEVELQHLSPAQRCHALKEAETMSTFNHANIIHYHEARCQGGVLYIVMEYAEAGDLSTVIQAAHCSGEYEALSEDRVLLWFVQICLALWHVHRKGVLHRDLKPQNVFLARHDVIKLGDFGIARKSGNDDSGSATTGTPFYLSPEVCEGHAYSTKSDVWALGCILYELLTAKRAFDGCSLPAVVAKVLHGRTPQLPSRYSSSLCNLLHDMLAPKPSERPSVDAILKLPWLRRHLERYADKMLTLSTKDGPSASPSSSSCSPAKVPQGASSGASHVRRQGGAHRTAARQACSAASGAATAPPHPFEAESQTSEEEERKTMALEVASGQRIAAGSHVGQADQRDCVSASAGRHGQENLRTAESLSSLSSICSHPLAEDVCGIESEGSAVNPFAILDCATSSRTLRPQFQVSTAEVCDPAERMVASAMDPEQTTTTEALHSNGQANELTASHCHKATHTGSSESPKPASQRKERRGTRRSWMHGNMAELDAMLTQLHASGPLPGSPTQRSMHRKSTAPFPCLQAAEQPGPFAVAGSCTTSPDKARNANTSVRHPPDDAHQNPDSSPIRSVSATAARSEQCGATCQDMLGAHSIELRIDVAACAGVMQTPSSLQQVDKLQKRGHRQEARRRVERRALREQERISAHRQHKAVVQSAKSKLHRKDLLEVGRRFAERGQKALNQRSAIQNQQAPTFIVTAEHGASSHRAAVVQGAHSCHAPGGRVAPVAPIESLGSEQLRPWRQRIRRDAPPSPNVHIFVPHTDATATEHACSSSSSSHASSYASGADDGNAESSHGVLSPYVTARGSSAAGSAIGSTSAANSSTDAVAAGCCKFAQVSNSTCIGSASADGEMRESSRCQESSAAVLTPSRNASAQELGMFNGHRALGNHMQLATAAKVQQLRSRLEGDIGSERLTAALECLRVNEQGVHDAGVHSTLLATLGPQAHLVCLVYKLAALEQLLDES